MARFPDFVRPRHRESVEPEAALTNAAPVAEAPTSVQPAALLFLLGLQAATIGEASHPPQHRLAVKSQLLHVGVALPPPPPRPHPKKGHLANLRLDAVDSIGAATVIAAVDSIASTLAGPSMLHQAQSGHVSVQKEGSMRRGGF